jgi:tetratricopeptide (TPR) repeat protein
VVKVLAGRDHEAETFFRQAISLKAAAFGKTQPHEIALSWGELGIQLFARGDDEAALAAFRTAHDLEVRDSSTSPINPSVAVVLNNIACCYFQMGNHEAALATLIEAREIQHDASSVAQADLDLLHVAIVIGNCGYLNLARKQYDEARSLFEEALLIQQSVLEDSHRAIRDTRSNIEFTTAFHSVD